MPIETFKADWQRQWLIQRGRRAPRPFPLGGTRRSAQGVPMATTLIDDPVLVRFRRVLDEMYGDQLDRVVLFGSRARGDARPDSDYDVAVFLKSLPDRWVELDRLARLRVKMIDETGAFFDAKPYPANALQERTPLMHEIRQDGLDL
jgi:uncharacterized protein